MKIRLLAALVFLSACATFSTGSSTHLRVMTWNIAAGHGNLGAIAEAIRNADPDIVALQEVDVHWSERSGFADQADSLGKLLHMNVRFAPIYHIVDSAAAKPAREFGVAILTKFPIGSSANHEITRLSTQQQNALPSPAPGFLETVIGVGGDKLRAFDTHLDYRGDPSVRRTQVSEMIRIIRSTSTPTILFGDLNATPGASELQPLFAILRDPIATSNANGSTYPAEAPVKRIDYVLVSNHFRLIDARVIETTSSDHRPVVADFLLARR